MEIVKDMIKNKRKNYVPEQLKTYTKNGKERIKSDFWFVLDLDKNVYELRHFDIDEERKIQNFLKSKGYNIYKKDRGILNK